VLLLSLVTAFTPILGHADPHINGVMTAIAGTRFQLAPTGQPGVFTHTVDGLAQVSVIGNCIVHMDSLAQAGQGEEPWTVEGTMQFIFPKDNSILYVKISGWVALEPGTPFGNLHYDVEILSGEGQFAGARGRGQMDGAGMFINPQGSEGTATWKFDGSIFTRPAK
jgi:hypothetical protein